MPIDYTDIADISCSQEGSVYGATEPPFQSSTIQYRELKDRGKKHPDLDGLSPEEVAGLYSDPACAIYTLDGYFGFAMVLDVSSPDEELQAKHIMEPLKEWSRSVYESGSVQDRLLPPPVPPACLLLRRPEPGMEMFLTVEAVMYLRSISVRLVGVESSSIASNENSSVLEPLMQEGDLSWLVKANLRNVRSNFPYFLCAFPVGELKTGPMPCRPLLIALSG